MMKEMKDDMKELGRSTQMNIHNIRSLIRTSQVCLGHLAVERSLHGEEYKHTRTHTNIDETHFSLRSSQTFPNCYFHFYYFVKFSDCFLSVLVFDENLFILLFLS